MTTRLTDVQFDEDIYLTYLQEPSTYNNAFVASGVAVTNAQLSARASGEGETTSIPFWKQLDWESENISSDDPNQKAVPDKITTGKLQARRFHVNNAWQTANLVDSVLGSESPMRQIRSLTQTYWDNRFALRVMATTQGVMNANLAANSDMIVKVASEDAATVTDANRFSYGAFVDALATMSEFEADLAAIGVHPDTLAAMRKNGEAIETIQDSQTGLLLNFYNGKRIIVDRRFPVLAGETSGFKYVTVLFGAGAIGYGEALATRPVAVEFDELAGNGAGVETLIERKQMIIHAAGHRWTDASVAAFAGPTVTEVALAANWSREFKRDHVPFAFIIHNN